MFRNFRKFKNRLFHKVRSQACSLRHTAQTFVSHLRCAPPRIEMSRRTLLWSGISKSQVADDTSSPDAMQWITRLYRGSISTAQR